MGHKNKQTNIQTYKPKNKEREETRKRITYYLMANASIRADLLKRKQKRTDHTIKKYHVGFVPRKTKIKPKQSPLHHKVANVRKRWSRTEPLSGNTEEGFPGHGEEQWSIVGRLLRGREVRQEALALFLPDMVWKSLANTVRQERTREVNSIKKANPLVVLGLNSGLHTCKAGALSLS